ncbi:MAG: hypothetical protein AAGE65_02895 [Planctomycetota bacterium]
MSFELTLVVKLLFLGWLYIWFLLKDRFGRPIPDSLTWLSIWLMIASFTVVFVALLNLSEGKDLNLWLSVAAIAAYSLGPIWGLPPMVYRIVKGPLQSENSDT